ncbi:YadA-like family protein [uncultured Megasphaera sp.]|uniref:YadA-like family protein n=1 Tax=Megasphaera massiliensis TaxID=1232428 RepID=UPI00266B4534|nr:YadA-like family protein [uncultured Megasphaera sp.]
MKINKTTHLWKRHLTTMLAVTAVCSAVAAPLTALAATQTVDDIAMKAKNIFNTTTETRSFKDAGLVPGKSNSKQSTAIGNIGFTPSIGSNSNMSVTVGDAAKVGDNAERSTALGYNSSIAKGAEQSVAIGDSTSVSKQESIAVGKSAIVDTQNAIAIGTSAKISSGAVNSIAIGGLHEYDSEGGLGGGGNYLIEANAKNSTVIGTAGLSQSEGGTAIGEGARVTFNAVDSVAIGHNSRASASDIKDSDKNGVVSFGNASKDVAGNTLTRRLINVSDGINDTDAATVGQMNTAIAEAAKTATQGVDDITMNTTDAFNRSTETRSFKDAGLVPGKSNSKLSTAIGNTGFGEPSIGSHSNMSVSIGDAAKVGDYAERSTAVGYNSKISEDAKQSIAIGESSSVSKQESIAVGKSAAVETQNAIAIGTHAKIAAGAVNSVAIGGLYEYDDEDGLGGGGTYLVESNAKNSTVIGAAGLSQSEGGTAIGEGARVTENAADSVALGHGSEVNASDIEESDKNGVVSMGITKNVDGSQVTRRLINISDGLNATDAATVGQMNTAIANTQSTMTGDIMANTIAIEQNSAAIETNTQRIGSGTLANGAADLTSAINQNTTSIQTNTAAIQTNAAAIEQNSTSIERVTTRVNSLGREVDSVGALSSALAGLHPIDYDGTSRFQISAAAGTYDGKQALALGAFYQPHRDIMYSLGASSTFGGDRKAAGNIGVTFRVGPGSPQTSPQNANEIEALRAEVEQLKAEIRELKTK